jgi:hypothetical protein
VEELSDLSEVLLSGATGGHGRGADTDAEGVKSRLISRDSVLVQSDIELVTKDLSLTAGNTGVGKVPEDEVGVGAAGDELVAMAGEAGGESARVGDDLLGIGMELRGSNLLELDGDTGDLVVVGSTLAAREDGLGDLALEVALIAAEEDNAGAGATEGLVGGGGDDIGEVEGVSNLLSSDEAGEMSHVAHEEGTDLVGDVTELLVVPITGVSGAAADDDLGTEQHGGLTELDEVDEAGSGVDAVRKRLEVDRGGRDLFGRSVEAVSEVSARRKVKAHNTVVRVQESGVNLEVSGRAGVRLNVDTPSLLIETKGSESTLLAHSLNLVNKLVTTIVTLARITLRVLVGEAGAKTLHNSTRGEVLEDAKFETK